MNTPAIGGRWEARRLLALLTTVALAAALIVMYSDSARADDHIPPTGPVPSHCVKFDVPDTGTQSPDDYGSVVITLISWENTPQDPKKVNFSISGLEANQWVEAGTKSGQNPQEFWGPFGNGTHSIESELQQAISHITLCVFEQEPTTTTTTEATTTTTEATTTTTEATTTTTEATTTTTVEDEVLPTVITTTTIAGTDLPLTGARTDALLGLGVVLLGLGLATLTMTRRLETE